MVFADSSSEVSSEFSYERLIPRRIRMFEAMQSINACFNLNGSICQVINADGEGRIWKCLPMNMDSI